MRRRRVPFGLDAGGGLDRRDFLITAAQLGAGILGASAFGLLGAAARADDKEFKVGWVRPTTGRLSSSFAPLYVGGLIAIEEINAAGGILGRPIVRIDEDDEALPAKQPGVIKKLQGEKISYVFGPTGTSQTLSSLATSTGAKMIQAAFANGAQLADGKKYPYHYQCTYNSDQQGELAVRYLVESLKLKKIGILQENTAFGEEATTGSRRTLKALGLEPVAVEVYPLNAPDLNGYVANLQKAGADGVVAWIANIPNAAMAFNAMNSLKWYPQITGHSGLFLDRIFDLVPIEAIRNVKGTFYKSLSWTDTEKPGERQVAFARKTQDYPEAKGSEVNVAASPYYDFLHILKQVIEAEKTFEVEKVKRALDNVRNYDGLLGAISFTPENHTGIGLESMCMAEVVSAREPEAMNVFRRRSV